MPKKTIDKLIHILLFQIKSWILALYLWNYSIKNVIQSLYKKQSHNHWQQLLFHDVLIPMKIMQKNSITCHIKLLPNKCIKVNIFIRNKSLKIMFSLTSLVRRTRYLFQHSRHQFPRICFCIETHKISKNRK